MKDLGRFTNEQELRAYIAAETRGVPAAAINKMLRERLPKESVYQSKIIHAIKANYPRAFVWKAAAGPYSRRGIPDICAVIDGRYFGLEVKRPIVGELSKIQDQTIKDIQAAGGVAGVVCFPEEALRLISAGTNKGQGAAEHEKWRRILGPDSKCGNRAGMQGRTQEKEKV